jgi:hypothetical protein
MPKPGNPRRQYQRPPPFDASGNVASRQFQNALARPQGAGLTQPPLHTPRSKDQQEGYAEDLHGGRDFRDSDLWRGRFWPYHVPLTFKLVAGQHQGFRLAYPARMQVMVTVGTGIASFFYMPANPAADQFHFQVGPNVTPFVFSLPPGAHRLSVLADAAQACTVSIFVVGLPPEDWDSAAPSP